MSNHYSAATLTPITQDSDSKSGAATAENLSVKTEPRVNGYGSGGATQQGAVNLSDAS